MKTTIYFCARREQLKSVLDARNILDMLRVPNTVRNHIHNIIITEQNINKRGSLKYVSIDVGNLSIPDAQVQEALEPLGADLRHLDYNGRRVYTIFSNNLTTLLKCSEELTKITKTQKGCEARISLSTDLPEIYGQQIYCCDFASFVSAIQLTHITEQEGYVFLGLSELGEEYILTILLVCINTSGKIKIVLDCEDYDKKIWQERAMSLLLEASVFVGPDVLENIIV